MFILWLLLLFVCGDVCRSLCGVVHSSVCEDVCCDMCGGFMLIVVVWLCLCECLCMLILLLWSDVYCVCLCGCWHVSYLSVVKSKERCFCEIWKVIFLNRKLFFILDLYILLTCVFVVMCMFLCCDCVMFSVFDCVYVCIPLMLLCVIFVCSALE